MLHNANPLTPTSTDRIFAVQTVSQGVVIDENDFFGEYALADSYNYIPVTTIVNGDTSIGQNTTLTFQFSRDINSTEWMRLRIPDQFESFPSTSVQCTINTPSGAIKTLNPIVSTVDQRWIELDLLQWQQAYPYKLNLTIKLPLFQTTTDSFLLELLANNTNTVMSAYTFSGMTTTPGNLSTVQFSSSSPNINSITNLTLNFLLTNPIVNGQVSLTFSSGFVLTKNCTTNYNNSHWTCYSQSQTMVVPTLTLFAGQNFSVQFLALNPSDATLAYSLSIQTFTNFNNTLRLVDTTQLPLILSSVQTPLFQAFDMYRPEVNATLSQVTALDFRLIPQPGNELPLTKVGGPDLSSIMLQIPLWWRASTQNWNDLQNRFYSYYSNCTFGVEGAYNCAYLRQLYTINTPIKQIDFKYPSNEGLAQCDKPVSIKNVMMPPIPGRYDFRVLTFKNKSIASTPTEQDMFTMDIPVDPFPSLTIESSSVEAADGYNLLKVSFKTGLKVPDEGTMNLNFSVTSNSTDSAW